MKLWTAFRKRFAREFTIRCPDGTIKFVYKDVEDAFPLLTKEFGVSASLQTDPVGTTGLGAQYRSKVNALFDGLNSQTNDLFAHLRAVYVVYKTDPCNKGDYLASRITEITDSFQQFRMQQLNVEILKDRARHLDVSGELATVYAKLENALVPAHDEIARTKGVGNASEVSKAFELSNEAASQLKRDQK